MKILIIEYDESRSRGFRLNPPIMEHDAVIYLPNGVKCIVIARDRHVPHMKVSIYGTDKRGDDQ